MNISFCVITVILIILILCIVVESILENRRINIKNISIANEKIFNEYNAVYISDFHNNNNDFAVNAITDCIKKYNIKSIIFGGDMITYAKFFARELKSNNFIKLLDKLKEENVSIYFGIGNHEKRVYANKKAYDKYRNDIEKLKKYPINVVLDKYYQINESINLYGFDFTKKFIYEKVRLFTLDKNKYNIAICHNPRFAQKLIDYGFDLVLSGHLHGGLIRLPFFGGLISPEFIPFPKYSKGLYSYKNKNILVSNGIGGHTFNIRVNNVCEIYLINLIKK